MWQLIIEAGILVGDYIYHRWIQDQPSKPNPGKSIKVPAATAGQTIPIYYGQVLIKTPILAWWGAAHAWAGNAGPIPNPNAEWVYGVDMFYVCGIGFSGYPQVELKNIYAGDLRLNIFTFDQDYGAYDGRGGINGTSYHQWPVENSDLAGNTQATGGGVQYLHGHPDQLMVDGSGNPLNDIAVRMLDQGINYYGIPGYRGYSSVGLMGRGAPTLDHWQIGTDPQPPNYAFEWRNTPEGAGSGFFVNPDNSVDINPMDAVYDILTGQMGKLGLDPSRLNIPSIIRCAETLNNEGHGLSRVWETGEDAKTYLDEIMAQIDGVYYEDPQSGLFTVKLIRPDYDPNSLPLIHPGNCSSIENFAASGWTDLANKIRVMYTDRANAYRDGTATAQNQANAVGQDGEVREVQLQFPGVTQPVNAQNICNRELAARSKPLIKFRAIVSSAFWRTHVGDVVMVDWPDANIGGLVMRVAAVSVGTLKDGSIILDLLQDYFYNYRGLQPVNIINVIGQLGTITLGF